MQEIVLVGSFLSLNSYYDIRYRKVCLPSLCIYAVVGILWSVFYNNASMLSILLGSGLGLLLVIMSRLSKGAVGMGDGWLLMVCGCMLGIIKNIELLFIGLMVSAVLSLFLLVVKRVKKNYEIPFVPFLLIAYVGMVCL